MEKFTNLTLEQYLQELSSEKPVPGGGSAAAYVASLAMGLTQMVARVSLKRKIKDGSSAEELQKEAEARATMQKIVDSIEKTKRDSFQIVNIDPQVYQEVMARWSDPARREEALKNSFRLQADLAFLIVMGYEWNDLLASLVKGSIKNDLLVSAALLEAAFRGAYHTALINVHYLTDSAEKQTAEQALHELKQRFEKQKALHGTG
jgi:formiminotetrahydrofolate cyclodeaminase